MSEPVAEALGAGPDPEPRGPGPEPEPASEPASEVEGGPAAAPVPLPQLTETGHPGVDAALGQLEQLADVPTGARAELFESVHQRLRDTLAALDQPRP
ncbi:hypothetical protein [Streptacidiphilus albus]|uniref:hypothetical protein n=1 Tax=Streptacidiphilus albus TaxID=105425 RepID=UPI0005A9DE5E|nr:hypothetical protein [Streptacidiphilus albus]